MREYASEVSNIFCLKSLIEGHRIHQLGSLANSAWVGHINLGFPAKCILNLWCIIFHSVQVSFLYFAILFQILSSYCEENMNEIYSNCLGLVDIKFFVFQRLKVIVLLNYYSDKKTSFKKIKRIKAICKRHDVWEVSWCIKLNLVDFYMIMNILKKFFKIMPNILVESWKIGYILIR